MMIQENDLKHLRLSTFIHSCLMPAPLLFLPYV